MPDLNSSNLASVYYDPEARTMGITFRGGGVYTYADVPETEYEGLLSAPSPGRYFAEKIKGKFSFTKG